MTFTLTVFNAMRLTPEMLSIAQAAINLFRDAGPIKAYILESADVNRWNVERHGNEVHLIRVTKAHADDGEHIATIHNEKVRMVQS